MSVSLLSKLQRDILGELQEAAYFHGKKTFENRLTGTFPAGLCSSANNYWDFVKEESTIRLTICTVVFGLGVNIPDERFVVHWGACDSALQYWQEVGRAGRDGNKAKAYMDTVSDWGSSDQGLCTFQLHFNNNNAKHDGKYHSKDVNIQMLKLGIQIQTCLINL